MNGVACACCKGSIDLRADIRARELCRIDSAIDGRPPQRASERPACWGRILCRGAESRETEQNSQQDTIFPHSMQH